MRVIHENPVNKRIPETARLNAPGWLKNKKNGSMGLLEPIPKMHLNPWQSFKPIKSAYNKK